MTTSPRHSTTPYSFRTASTLLVVCFLCWQIDCLAQENSKLHFGGYAGLNLSYFTSAYRSSPLPGWKAGLVVSTKGHSRFDVSGKLGLTQDKCRINMPALPFHTFWKYLWADFTPMLHYVPLRREKFSLSAGSGISVRRIITTSIGEFKSTNDAIYNWTYFLPLQLSTTFALARQRQLGLSVEYSRQLRNMYRPENWNASVASKLHSWNLVASYVLPYR